MFLSCHVRVSEWIHTLYLSECQGTSCSKQARSLKFKWLQLDSNPKPQWLSVRLQTKRFWVSCSHLILSLLVLNTGKTLLIYSMWFLKRGSRICTNKTSFSLIISSKNMKLFAWLLEFFYIYYRNFCNRICLKWQFYEIDLSRACYKIIKSWTEHFAYTAVVC